MCDASFQEFAIEQGSGFETQLDSGYDLNRQLKNSTR
jgi:hypothetical protein